MGDVNDGGTVMAKGNYWIVSRPVAAVDREFFAGVTDGGTAVSVSGSIFDAFTFASRAEAELCIEKVLTANDLLGFAVSDCSSGKSKKLRVRP